MLRWRIVLSLNLRSHISAWPIFTILLLTLSIFKRLVYRMLGFWPCVLAWRLRHFELDYLLIKPFLLFVDQTGIIDRAVVRQAITSVHAVEVIRVTSFFSRFDGLVIINKTRSCTRPLVSIVSSVVKPRLFKLFVMMCASELLRVRHVWVSRLTMPSRWCTTISCDRSTVIVRYRIWTH